MLIIIKRDNLFKLFGFVSNMADREASTASLCRDATDVGHYLLPYYANMEVREARMESTRVFEVLAGLWLKEEQYRGQAIVNVRASRKSPLRSVVRILTFSQR